MKWNFDFLFKREPTNLNAQLDEGRRAEAFMQDRTWQDALRSVREGLHLRWAGSPVADKDGQHLIRLELKLLDDLEGNIRTAISDGLMAQQEIKHQQHLEQHKREREKRGLSRVA